MIYQKRIQLTKLALALSIALAGAPALAQNTTSAVAGRISGADGQPAAGASVQIIHTESGSVSTVTTDAAGRYAARGLRTGGPYTIIITKNGQTEKREGIFLQLAETANIDATVGQMQTVTVAGNRARSDIFNRSNMGAGTGISNTQLQIQASINRNLQDYARADPRVSQTDKERGELSVAGQNSRYTSTTVDGVAINDTFGLEASGSPTSRQPISIEAIQSVQVNVANYDVTQKGYTGGNINAVTKSGTNNWKGGVYYVFRNDNLSGDRYDITKDTYSAPPKSEETTKGVWASGALVQDKLFIYALSEETKSTRSSPDYGPVGSNTGTTVGISPDQIKQVQDIVKQRYGVDAGGLATGGGKFVSREQMVKFDWNISDNHRANLRYQRTRQGEPQYSTFSATALSLDSAYYNQQKEIETTVAQVFSDWTPTFSTELKASNRDYDSVPKNNTTLPTIGVQFTGALPAGTPAGVGTGSRTINLGTDNSRHMNVLGTRTQDYYAGANWTVGDHEIKFGSDYQKNKVYNAFLQNVYGNYTFGCDNNLSYSFGNINCSTASAADVQRAVLENLRTGRFTSYSYQVPAPGYTLDDAVAKFDMTNTGLFLQDTWNVNRQLTLTAGFRWDKVGVNGTPIANTRVAAPVIAGVNGGRQTGGFGYNNQETIDGTKLFQPRFGFNYNFATPRRMQLRGGVGLFQGAAMTVWLGNPFQNAGIATQQVTCSGTGTSRCPTTALTTGGFSTDVNNQPTLGGSVPPQANVDLLDPNLRQPSIWKANLAFEMELPWYGLVASAEYLAMNTKDGIYFQNLNLGAPTRIGADGRQLFWNASGLSSANWTVGNNSVSVRQGATNTTKSLSNSGFGNVLKVTGTDKGESRISTLSLSYPMTKGFGWSVAATHTSATEVSNLTSSTASSNFNARSVLNPNEDVAANSAYLVKNRVNALLNFQKAFFGTYKTSFGVFYEGRSGKPYSWTFKNDLNGDGVSGNDLMYIPRAFGSGDVIFAGDSATNHANEQRFWDVVNGNKTLRQAAGGTVSRYGDFSNWTNSFDLRLAQEIPGMFKRNKASISFDILNFGNLLNKKWGHINEVPFFSAGGQTRGFVDYAGLDPATGKYVYAVRSAVDSYQIRQAKGESQWAMQVTVKYEF